MQRMILFSGWTGAGKSTMANAIATELSCAIGSFDWLMSALRAFPDVWTMVEQPVERQRAVGWTLLSRLVEQELRGGRSIVLDLVAREAPRTEWEDLAARYGARTSVIECICSDAIVHRERIDGRDRGIPGWYELDWSSVERQRVGYEPLAEPKLVLDSVDSFDENHRLVRAHLGLTSWPG